jgi:hypothetical protein
MVGVLVGEGKIRDVEGGGHGVGWYLHEDMLTQGGEHATLYLQKAHTARPWTYRGENPRMW